jgi:hypothetical protein
VQAYGISTMTAQRALQDLRSRGITHGMPGKGTYVRPDAKMRLDHPTGEDFGVGLPHTQDPQLNQRIDAFNTELLHISAAYAVDHQAATGDPYQEERAWEEAQDRLRGEFAANTDLLLAVAHQQAAEDNNYNDSAQRPDCSHPTPTGRTGSATGEATPISGLAKQCLTRPRRSGHIDPIPMRRTLYKSRRPLRGARSSRPQAATRAPQRRAPWRTAATRTTISGRADPGRIAASA